MPSEFVGTIVQCEEENVYLIVGKDCLIRAQVQDNDLQFTKVLDLIENITSNRFNDGKVDPHGTLWAGTMSIAEEDFKGSLYSFPKHKQTFSVQKHLTNVSVSNGLVWDSTASTMYYIDSPEQQVVAYSYQYGSIGNDKRVVFTVPFELGYPDGMAIDSQDKLWIAFWKGNSICRVDPLTGTILCQVNVPGAHHVTACAFARNMQTGLLTDMYITTAQYCLSKEEQEQHKQSGSLFFIDLHDYFKSVGAQGTLFHKLK